MSHPTFTRFFRTSTTAFAVLAVAVTSFGSDANAARTSEMTGTIALQDDAATRSTGPELSYGATAKFDTSVSGRPASKGYFYVTVVCSQGDVVVYQASNMDLSAGFKLTDQDGQNLVWDGGPAECTGAIVYRIDGRNPTIQYLDQTAFNVG